MRAADNCHPLPDQTAPVLFVFSVPSYFALRRCSEPRRSMRFHDAFDRFRGRSRFCPENCSFPWAWCLFASLVSSSPSCCRLRVFARLSGYEGSDQDRFFRASVKEGAKSATRDEFHRWVLELSSLSPARGFATATERERAVFCSPQLPIAFLRFVSDPKELTPDLPLRALALAHASHAPLFVGVAGSHFVFLRMSLASHPEGKEQRPSIIDFCN